MRVSELMHTPAVTCSTSATLGDVARLMRDRRVGCVLVTDRIGYLAGIVTDRDLAIRGLAEGRSADIPVEAVMTRDVATVSVHADVRDATTTMSERQVRRLPVVDEQDRAHGVIALDDLIREVGRETESVAETILRQST